MGILSLALNNQRLFSLFFICCGCNLNVYLQPDKKRLT